MSFYSAPQGWVCRSCPVPNRTQELISFSASANGSANDHETRGEMMMKLSEGNTMLIWVEGGTGVMLKEQTFELLGVGKVEIGADSIIDVRALAGASWPEVVGGPEGKYQGGVSLMQAEQELIGMNASIQGRQLNTELTGQGGLEVRVVGDAFIAGSGQMAVDWSDGISVEASIADRDQDEVIGVSLSAHAWTTENEIRGDGMMKLSADNTSLVLAEGGAGVMLKEETFALTGIGKVVIGDTDLGAHVEATWPEVVIGPEGEYDGMFRLTVNDSEVFGLNTSMTGDHGETMLSTHGLVRVRIMNEDTIIDGTSQLDMDWTDGLQFDAVVVDADKHEVLFNVSAATNGVVSDEESMRGQAIMQLHVKMSDQDNLAMQCVLSGNLPTGTNMQEGKDINSTNVWIWTDLVEAMMKSHNNVTHGQKKEHLHGKAMLELKVSERALILADVGGVMILVEPSIGILGTALVVIGDYPIVDMQASAGATWPEVVGGPEGKYQGGVSLMQAEQELIGMNASIEGRQLNTELTGQGGLEVRVVGDAFIAGSGQMAVDWSDGISVEASLGGLGPPRACEMDYSMDGSIPSLERLPSPTNALFEMCYANSSRHYEYSINPAGTQEGPRCRDGWWEAWPDGACKCVFCPEDTWYRDGKCFSKCVDGRSRFVTIPGTPVTVSMYGLIATAAVGRGGLTSTATGSLASERSQCPYAEATNCHDCNCPAGKFCVYVQDGECACHSCHQGWEYRGGKCIQPCPQGRRLSKTSAALSSATGEITEEVWVCSSCPAGFKLVCTNEWASSCDCFEASAVDWDVTMCTNSSNGQHLTDTEVVDPTSSDPSVTECPEIAGTTDWSKCGCKLETHGQTTWIGEKYMCAKCPFLSSFFVSGLRPTCHRCPQGHDYRINNYGGYYKGICFKQCKAGSWLTTRNVVSVLTCDGGMVVGKNRWGSYGCYDCPTGRVEFDWWSMTMQCYPQDKVRLECGAT
jgi:hypothetical protein